MVYYEMEAKYEIDEYTRGIYFIYSILQEVCFSNLNNFFVRKQT